MRYLNNLHRSVKIGVVTLLILTVFFAYYHIIKWEAEYNFFAEALSNARVSDAVLIAGIRFETDSGHVYIRNRELRDFLALPALKLAYESAMLRRQPLFSISGTDPDLLLSEIKKLRIAESEFLAVAKNKGDFGSSLKSIYPFDFIEAMSKLEKTRIEFINTPSFSKSILYRWRLHATVEAFKKNLEVFRRIILSDKKVIGSFINSFEGRITGKSLLETLDYAMDKFSDTYLLQKKRFDCLSGEIGSCSEKDLSMPDLPQYTNLSRENMLRIPEKVLNIESAILEATGIETDRPVIAIEKSFCAGYLPTPHYFSTFHKKKVQCYLENTKKAASPARREPENVIFVEFTGDVIVSKIPPERKDAWSHALRALGTKYELYPLFGFYSCPSYTKDQSKVLSIRAIYDMALKNPKLALEESSVLLSNRDLVTEKSAITFLSSAMKKVSSSYPVNQETLNSLIDIAVSLNNNSRGFEHLISNVSANTERLKYIRYNNLLVNDPVYRVLSRSGFSSFFMFQNISIFGDKLPSLFDDIVAHSEESTKKIGFISYESEKNAMPSDVLVKALLAGYILHEVPNLASVKDR